MSEAEQPALLASDADRERGVGVLRDAVVEGRLTLEEFSDRVERAQLARTERDLQRLLADLPTPASVVSVAPAAPSAAVPAEAPVKYRALFSRLVRGGPWELPARASFRSICGTIELDLREARLHGDEVLLDVYNFCGTVKIVVPEGISVTVEGGGLFASQIVEPSSGPPLPGAPRLRIRAAGPGGTLHVSSREPRSAFADLLGAVRAQLPG